MTNYLDSAGLHLESLTEIVDQLESDFKAVYGADINLDANSPDAQMIRIFAQAKFDMLAVIADVYATMSPDQAVGSVLDQRCVINGLIRRGATYTYTNVTVTADRDVTLAGLDTTDAPFTVEDSTGNQFYLVTGVSLAAGSTALQFRAAEAGEVQTTIGTITTVTTVTLGITAVNNPDAALTTGINEETDAELRIRRRESVSLASTGYVDGLKAALRNIDAVTDAEVYENVTSSTDANGIPGHSIWAIVDGGDATEIATAIYQKRSAGCGMKGDETVTIEGTAISYDQPTYQDLYIAMELLTIDPVHTIDDVYIAEQIAERIVYGIYDPADFSAIVALVKEIDPLAVVDTGGVSDTASGYISFKYPDTVQHRWIVDVSRINITVV